MNNGRVDGAVDWTFKGYMAYRWANGATVALSGYLDSGFHYSPMAANPGQIYNTVSTCPDSKRA